MYIYIFLFLVEYSPHAQHWLLLDRVVQQVVLQQPSPSSRSTSSHENLQPPADDTSETSATYTKVQYLSLSGTRTIIKFKQK